MYIVKVLAFSSSCISLYLAVQEIWKPFIFWYLFQVLLVFSFYKSFLSLRVSFCMYCILTCIHFFFLYLDLISNFSVIHVLIRRTLEISMIQLRLHHWFSFLSLMTLNKKMMKSDQLLCSWSHNFPLLTLSFLYELLPFPHSWLPCFVCLVLVFLRQGLL